MSSPVSYDLQGQGGGVVLGTEVLTATGNFRWLQVITDTVFSTLTSSNLTNTADLLTITVPAGVGIGGRFTVVTVTSGVVIAYSV